MKCLRDVLYKTVSGLTYEDKPITKHLVPKSYVDLGECDHYKLWGSWTGFVTNELILNINPHWISIPITRFSSVGKPSFLTSQYHHSHQPILAIIELLRIKNKEFSIDFIYTITPLVPSVSTRGLGTWRSVEEDKRRKYTNSYEERVVADICGTGNPSQYGRIQ